MIAEKASIMKDVLDVRIEQSLVHGSLVRTALIRGCGLDCSLSLEIADQRLPAPRVEDGFAFLLIFFAMEHAASLRIHAPLSRRAYLNLRVFQEAWRCMCPDRYRIIEIEPDSILLQPRGEDAAISAFSGGVDSSFVAVRHGKRLLGAASYPVKTVLMGHGFDVHYDDADAFDRLCRRTRPILEDCGLSSVIVRTNFRKIIPHNWDHCFGACLAGTLQQFAGRFGFGMMGSGKSYSTLVFPMGSTPATDYLLSGDSMEIVHEGAGYSRTEKVADIASYPTVTDRVKVCWEGTQQDRNCGHCEKCVRTRLNFLAVGIENPNCFDTPFDLSMIDGVTPHNSRQLDELRAILEYVEARAIAGEWVQRLRRRLGQLTPQAIGLSAEAMPDLAVP